MFRPLWGVGPSSVLAALNLSLCYEDCVCLERHYTEVSGQLHYPTALPLRKSILGREAGWASESVWTFWRRERYLLLLRIELRFTSRTARSLLVVYVLRSLVALEGLNPAGDIDVCLLWVLCVVRQRSLLRAGHSSIGVLPSVVCLMRAIAKPLRGGHDPESGRSATGGKIATWSRVVPYKLLLKYFTKLSTLDIRRSRRFLNDPSTEPCLTALELYRCWGVS